LIEGKQLPPEILGKEGLRWEKEKNNKWMDCPGEGLVAGMKLKKFLFIVVKYM
jgi:hypothetical protein